jgi:hypothetical protein
MPSKGQIPSIDIIVPREPLRDVGPPPRRSAPPEAFAPSIGKWRVPVH